MGTYVLVHGAWHTGELLEDVAKYVRSEGHTVYTPTLAGNRPGDSKETGLDQAIDRLVDYFSENSISDAAVTTTWFIRLARADGIRVSPNGWDGSDSSRCPAATTCALPIPSYSPTRSSWRARTEGRLDLTR
jgi:hypothetical protein